MKVWFWENVSDKEGQASCFLVMNISHLPNEQKLEEYKTSIVIILRIQLICILIKHMM